MASWTPISEHRRTAKGLLQTTWPFLVFGSMLFAFGFMMQIVPTRPGEEMFTRIMGALAILGSLGILGVAPWRFFLGAVRVQVSKEGLHWEQGGHEHEQAWSEVAEVYRKDQYVLVNGARPSDWNRRSNLRLVFKDGSQARFNHILSDYNALAGHVQNASAECLLPAAREAIRGGGASFGPIGLSREGLRKGQEVFPLAGLQQVWVGGGDLGFLDARGYKHTVALKDIPNYPVLLHLLEEMREAASSSPPVGR